MRTLIAGLGNIFLGDDGVGVEIVQSLQDQPWPDDVVIRDYGIRGVHLAYELLDGYDLVVIVDAVQLGAPPGTVHVIEHDPVSESPAEALIDAHDMAPDDVLALVPALGGTLGRVIVIGCEVNSLEPGTELSREVRAATATAGAEVRRIVYALTDNETTKIGGDR